ncbi:MAG: DUF1566 domain-containing protein [bacterium]
MNSSFLRKVGILSLVLVVSLSGCKFPWDKDKDDSGGGGVAPTPIADGEWQIIDDDLVTVGTGGGNYLMWPRDRGSAGCNNDGTIGWKTSATLGQPTWDNVNKCYNYPVGESADTYPAFRWAENLVYKGYSNWRLPTKDELKELYDYGRTYISYAATLYWSSTEYSATLAYGVVFDIGLVNVGRKSAGSNYYVRAVRSSQ